MNEKEVIQNFIKDLKLGKFNKVTLKILLWVEQS